MAQALVTGAGGFIGSHLAERLVRDGWEVRGFVRYSSHDQRGALAHADPELKDAVEVVAGDLRDADAVRQAARGCDTIFHLGAMVSIPYSYRAPRDVVETNVLGTLNVLCAAREHGTRRVVHTSTSEVYGTAQTASIDEGHVQRGQSPYSASKIGADKLAEAFHLSFGVPVVTLRPFNTYGPRQSPRAIVPTIITQAQAGGPLRLGSLSPTRDFTYVTDTVAAFVLAASAPEAAGEVVHLGTGVEVSVAELVDLVGQMLGRRLDVETDEARVRPPRSEVARLLSDPDRAWHLLGWQPVVTLPDGLRRTAEWLARGGAEWFQLPAYGV